MCLSLHLPFFARTQKLSSCNLSFSSFKMNGRAGQLMDKKQKKLTFHLSQRNANKSECYCRSVDAGRWLRVSLEWLTFIRILLVDLCIITHWTDDFLSMAMGRAHCIQRNHIMSANFPCGLYRVVQRRTTKNGKRFGCEKIKWKQIKSSDFLIFFSFSGPAMITTWLIPRFIRSLSLSIQSLEGWLIGNYFLRLPLR